MSVRTVQERAAHARWAARRRRLQAFGEWKPFMDAEPVRAHMRVLLAAGMPESCVVKALGMPRGALRSVMRGSGSYGPAQKVRWETGEAVLGFWPGLEDFPDFASIDPTGTRRRAQALGALGWTQATLARRLGKLEASFKASLRGKRVSARFARMIKSAYDELWDQRPEDYGVAGWVADRARRQAAVRGWCGPLAWDDDTIDDPQAVPQLDAPPAGYAEGPDVVDRFLMGESVVLDRARQLEVIVHLMEWSQDSPAEIGVRLGMSAAAVSQSWERAKRRARDEGVRIPWRRVYVSLRELDVWRGGVAA